MSSSAAMGGLKITSGHLARLAVVYMRQSSSKQVRQNQESQVNQRSLVERAQALGWHDERIQVLDGDLGQSGAQVEGRDDFKVLTAEVALGHVGIIFGWQVSRLARNNADWYQLLDPGGPVRDPDCGRRGRVRSTLIQRPTSLGTEGHDVGS